MRLLALALAATACGGGARTADPAPAGIAPAIDALVAAVRAGALPALDVVAEPIGVPLHHDRPLWRVAGAKGHVVGVDAGGGIVVWDARSARPLARFQATTITPEQIAIAPDGQRLALCAGPNAEVIDLDTGASAPLSTHAPIVGCAWFPDGRLAIAAAGLETFDAKQLAPLEPMDIAEPPATLAIDATGAVAITTTTGARWLWSGKGGDPPKLVEASTAPKQPADALDAAGRWVVTPRGLVDPGTDRPVLAIPDTIAAFGDQLVTARGDAAMLWSFGGLLIGHSDAITSIVPRGERLLTASRDGLAIVWKNGAIQHAMPRAAAPLVGAGFVTDTRLAAGDASGEVHLWDIDSGADLAHWTYPAGLACLVVQPDGRIAVATIDHQYETRDAVLTHPSPLASSPCATAPPTATMGDWRITGDASGALRLHPLSVQTAVARACGILRRFDRADELAACR